MVVAESEHSSPGLMTSLMVYTPVSGKTKVGFASVEVSSVAVAGDIGRLEVGGCKIAIGVNP